VRAAEEGERVLVVSTDPAHSLADALGVHLAAAPRRIRTRQGALFAVELDADGALTRWLEAREPAFRTIATRGTYLDDEDIDRFFRLSLPGVDELVGLVEVMRLARERPYDRVIVDTAPTGHTLRLLGMPAMLRRIAEVLSDMQAKHRFLSESLGGAYRPDAADTVIDEIEREGALLGALLRDPVRCQFTWVMLPEEMSIAESKDAVVTLGEIGVSVARVVVNRATPEPKGKCAACGPRVSAEKRAFRAIANAFPGGRVSLVEAQEQEPRGVDALRTLGENVASRIEVGVKGDVGGSRTRMIPDGLKLLLFGGKGGVGKTSCAVAAALAIAEEAPDRRILVLSVDPAHSLADALGVVVGDEGRSIEPGVFAREIDADRVFSARRERYRHAVDELFDSFLRGSRFDATYDRAVVQDLIDLAPPGLDELFGVLALVDALVPKGDAKRAPYDLVVLDTAPTGHTLRLLAMPETALEWVHALLAILLKYRRVVHLGALAEDLLEAARELKALDEMLHDPKHTRFVVVTRAGEVVRAETVRLVRALDDAHIPRGTTFVNALTLATPRCSRCERLARFEAKVLAKLQSDSVGASMLLAPAVYPPPRGRQALSSWSKTWMMHAR
jgi:arsenite-transporting ATPase